MLVTHTYLPTLSHRSRSTLALIGGSGVYEALYVYVRVVWHVQPAGARGERVGPAVVG